MKKIKREKAFWKKYFHFPENLEEIPVAVVHINLRCTEVDDEDLQYLVKRMQVIEMLDLDQTDISNAGIRELLKLKGLKELRLKDNFSIDNDCITDLNQLTSLELLHLGHTAVTIEGMLHLSALKNLKRLIFTVENKEVIQEKMQQLHTLLPGCTFLVNGTSYTFDNE